MALWQCSRNLAPAPLARRAEGLLSKELGACKRARRACHALTFRCSGGRGTAAPRHQGSLNIRIRLQAKGCGQARRQDGATHFRECSAISEEQRARAASRSAPHTPPVADKPRTTLNPSKGCCHTLTCAQGGRTGSDAQNRERGHERQQRAALHSVHHYQPDAARKAACSDGASDWVMWRCARSDASVRSVARVVPTSVLNAQGPSCTLFSCARRSVASQTHRAERRCGRGSWRELAAWRSRPGMRPGPSGACTTHVFALPLLGRTRECVAANGTNAAIVKRDAWTSCRQREDRGKCGHILHS